MIKSAHKFIIYIAAAILLLHNLTPHLHIRDLRVARYEWRSPAGGQINFLQSVFQNDLGDAHHLENFECGQADHFDVDGFETVDFPVAADAPIEYNDPFLPLFVPIADRPGSLRRYFSDSGNHIALFVFSNIGLRGPPYTAC